MAWPPRLSRKEQLERSSQALPFPRDRTSVGSGAAHLLQQSHNEVITLFKLQLTAC
jgi:hypothetical protein